MVSITLSVPEETRKLMKRFPEMNWSGFIRDEIERKIEELKFAKEIHDNLDNDPAFKEWLKKAIKERNVKPFRKQGHLKRKV